MADRHRGGLPVALRAKQASVHEQVYDFPEVRIEPGYHRSVACRDTFFLLDLGQCLEDVGQHLLGLCPKLTANAFFDGLDVGSDGSGDSPQVGVQGLAQLAIHSLLKELIKDKGQEWQIGRVRTRVMDEPASEGFGYLQEAEKGVGSLLFACAFPPMES